MRTGVARRQIKDLDAYSYQLSARLEPSAALFQTVSSSVRANPKRIVFAEGEEESVIRAAASFHLEDLFLDGAHYRVVFFVVLKKIGNVEERVALQPDVDKCRLHSGQNARYAALVDTSRQGIFFFAFVEKLHDLVVFDDGNPCFMAPRRDD